MLPVKNSRFFFVLIPISPEIEIECGCKNEKGAGVEHERLGVGVEGGAVQLAHCDIGGKRGNRRDDGNGAEYLAHLVGFDAAAE